MNLINYSSKIVQNEYHISMLIKTCLRIRNHTIKDLKMNEDELSFYSYMVIIVHLKHCVSTFVKICRSTHMVCVEAHLDPKVKWFLK
jgi:hypothetical protein